ncbi:neuroligin-4, X-linked-like [Liolophura sinensis]|uniref:neuroligin-4, X-linked-like n=1 Tax=Liolophura sinensis TaxID=3198878 RepID=UPI0031589E03
MGKQVGYNAKGVLLMMLSLALTFFLPHVETKVYIAQMSSRVVSTRFGQVRGALVEFEKDRNLKPVEAYLGLQYASLLGGSLRFMPPTSPMEKWNRIRAVMKHRKVCPQRQLDERELEKTLPKGRVRHLASISAFIREQTEDCLNLNLYVPTRDNFDWITATTSSPRGKMADILSSVVNAGRQIILTTVLEGFDMEQLEIKTLLRVPGESK